MVDLVLLDSGLDQMILEVFSNLNEMILSDIQVMQVR